MKKDNRGLSLVELLVAVSLAAIVAGSIGFLLTTSLRMYNKETVSATLQQELQVTVNQIMDYAMESETIVADFDGNYPDYLALGTFKAPAPAEGAEVNNSIVNKTTLEAEIFWLDGDKLYMKKADVDGFCLNANPADEDFGTIDKSKITALIPSAGNSSDAYLLAQYVKEFKVSEIGGIKQYTDEDGNTKEAFENPVSITINLEFEKQLATAKKDNKVEETIYLRNKVVNNIFVNISGHSNKTYPLYREKEVSIETVTVDMEKNAGIIQIPGNDDGPPSEDLNILEIVPDYRYDYVQYILGGNDGKLLGNENVTYGSSAAAAGVTPIKSEEFETLFCATAGYDYNAGYGEGGFYPNDGADIPAICILENQPCVGYYEYVGENQGYYAIEGIDVEKGFSKDKGYGDSKPKIQYFVPSAPAWYDESKYTTQNYNPEFSYILPNDWDGTEHISEYLLERSVAPGTMFYQVSSAWYTEGGEYDEVTLEKQNVGWTETRKIYKYVGSGNGHYSVEFSNATSSYNSYSTCYAVKGDPCDSFSKEGGRYSGYVGENDGWEHRVNVNEYSDGFDYLNSVKNVRMYARTYDASSSNPISNDFGWVWHEEKSGALHDQIVNGERVTVASVIEKEEYKNFNNSDETRRIYVKDHKRNIAVNNETFKLLTMQDILENYTPNNMLDIRYGVWDKSAGNYCSVNKNALTAWENAGHKISLNVRTPGDVTSDDIDDCDLVIIGLNGDGGFDAAIGYYSAIRNVSAATASYSESNDLSFSNTLKLYKKVIAEETGIACPYGLISAGGSKASINISRLFEMLYCIVNDDISKSSIIDSTINEAKAKKIEKQGESTNYWTVDPTYQSALENKVMVSGSGRELFTDFIKSMEEDALSKPLYDSGELTYKTSDIIYIEESGSNAGSLIVPAKNSVTIDGYLFNNSGKVISTWGGGGGTGLSAFDTNVLQWNTNHFLADRYRSEYTGYDKNGAYVWNAAYNHFYKFSYKEPQEGVYRNQLVWNQTSDLLHFNKTGANGAVGIQVVRKNTKNKTTSTPADIIGEMNYIGADTLDGYQKRRDLYNSVNTSEKQHSEMGDYSLRIIEYPDYLADPSDPGSVVTRKVLYLTEEQFKKAQTEGIYLYVLVTTSKDPSNYNKCVIWYDKNEKDAEGKTISWRFDYNNDDGASSDNVENHENCIKFAQGLKADGTPDPAKKYVREYIYWALPQYFQNIAPAYNNKNNMLIAKIERTSERKYEGNDTLYIYVRDTFDLD